jgi:hypothetical protein
VASRDGVSLADVRKSVYSRRMPGGCRSHRLSHKLNINNTMNNAIPSIITLTFLGLAYGSVAAADSASYGFNQLPIGGANVLGIDQALAAKIFSVTAIIQGDFFVLAPMIQAKWYGCDKAKPYKEQIIVEFIGGAIVATGIAPYCKFFHGTDYVLAVAITCTFLSFFFVRSFLNGIYKKAGMPIEKFVLLFVPAFIALYAGFTAQEWALSYFKTLDVLCALIALQEIFYPRSAESFEARSR